jgi:anti-anti-sigma factor
MNEESTTTISHEDIGEDLRRIVIMGRLDTPGTNAIEAELRELTSAPKRGVIVDLSAVQFAASIAIGKLIVNAQAVKARGGHMVVIVIPHSAVMVSFTTTGIDKIVPVFTSATDAYVGALRGF